MVRTRRKYRNYSNVSSLLFCERGWKAAQAAIAAVRPCGAARRARRRLHRLVLGFLLAPQVQRFRFAYFWAATSGDDGVRWQRSRWRRCGGGGEARPHQTRRRPWTREGIAAEQTWDDVGSPTVRTAPVAAAAGAAERGSRLYQKYTQVYFRKYIGTLLSLHGRRRRHRGAGGCAPRAPCRRRSAGVGPPTRHARRRRYGRKAH